MSDLLVRGLPEAVLAALNARAAGLGLSRSEYVRRRLTQDAQRSDNPVAVADLKRFTEAFGDLGDDEVMAQAWE